jgi:hypothetical protein
VIEMKVVEVAVTVQIGISAISTAYKECTSSHVTLCRSVFTQSSRALTERPDHARQGKIT